jgi:ABC-2 type transport system permease protein
VETFHNDWRTYFYPRILEGRAMMPNDLASLPGWNWTELPAGETRTDAWWRTILMLVLAFCFSAIAWFRSHRYSVA